MKQQHADDLQEAYIIAENNLTSLIAILLGEARKERGTGQGHANRTLTLLQGASKALIESHALALLAEKSDGGVQTLGGGR